MTTSNAVDSIFNAGGCLMHLPPGQKFPPPDSFPTKSPDELLSTCVSGHNMAVRCGHGLLVIDVDVDPTKGVNGRDSLAMLGARLGPLPATLEAVTPRGGSHLYFHTAPGIRNGASKLGRGIDVRSDGGYVVAPPSSLPNGAYAWVNQEPIAELPRAWREALLDLQKPKEAPKPVASTMAFTEEEREKRKDRAVRYLDAMGGAVSGQGGHNHTFTAACVAVRLCVTEDDAFEVLLDWNKQCDPPWSEWELRHKLNDALGKHAIGEGLPEEEREEAKVIDLWAGIADAPAATVAPAAKGARYGFLKSVVRLTPETFNADPEPVKYLWDKLVPDEPGTVGILGGAGGLGKTSLLVALAVRRACGLHYLGRQTKPGKTFVVSLEEHHRALMRRLAAARDTTPGVDASKVSENIVLLPQSAESAGWMMVSEMRGGNFAVNVEAVEELASAINETLPGCDLVVLETVSRLTPDEGNSAAAALIKAGELLGSRVGAVVTFVHHINKAASSSGSTSTESLRGASAFSNNARFALMMAPYTKQEGQRLLPGMAAYPDELARRLDLLLLFPSKGNETKRSDRAATVLKVVETKWAAAFEVYEHNDGTVALETYETEARTKKLDAALLELATLLEQNPGEKFTQRRLEGAPWKSKLPSTTQKEVGDLVVEAVARGLITFGPVPPRGTHPTIVLVKKEALQ